MSHFSSILSTGSIHRRDAEDTAGWTHIFNDRMLNEARFGYTRFNFAAVVPVNPALPSSAGFTGITPQNPAAACLWSWSPACSR